MFTLMNEVDIGVAIRARRKELRLTQQSLSELSAVSLHTISDIESGKGNPTLETLEQLLTPLGLELALRLRTPL